MVRHYSLMSTVQLFKLHKVNWSSTFFPPLYPPVSSPDRTRAFEESLARGSAPPNAGPRVWLSPPIHFVLDGWWMLAREGHSADVTSFKSWLCPNVEGVKKNIIEWWLCMKFGHHNSTERTCASWSSLPILVTKLGKDDWTLGQVILINVDVYNISHI